MAKTFRCETCKKDFKSLGALEQHNAHKHPVATKKEPFKLNSVYLVYAILLLIIVGIVWAVYIAVQDVNECKTADVLTIGIKDHSFITEHNHAILEIIIDGKKQEIRSNIGVEPNLMRPLHTHDFNGEIHIEGPCKRDYILGDFFKIWNAEFNDECVLDHCGGKITMTVNGEENYEFENLVLKDDQQIRIEYTSTND